ncbi:MAG: MFS transporter [Firmicutes bacterium]|jgi:ACDE family multidrug resistance protein|nr:MFS transporter [Bacillota bacterium]MDH7496315.1 MFS transporter [Bacillota bacterium]
MRLRDALPFAVLCTVPFILVLGNSMLIPVLPRVRAALHLTQAQTGLFITAFSVPAGLTIMLVGALSDRIGRKRVMVPSLVTYGIGGILAALAALFLEHPYWLILAARVVQGIGAAGTGPIATAVAGDMFQSQERTRAVGILEASNGLGKVISPVLGAGAALVAWWAPFLLFAVVALPSAAGVWAFCPESAPSPAQRVGVRAYFADLATAFREKRGSLAACYAAGAIVLFVLFGVLFYVSDTLEERHRIGGVVKGILISIPVFVMSVTSLLTGLVLERRVTWLKASVVIGLALVAGSLGLLAFVSKVVWLAILTAVIGLGSGLVLPSINTMVTSASSGRLRGMVTSVYGAVRFLGVAAGPPVFGLIMDSRRVPVFLPAAVAAGVCALLVLLALDQELLTPPKSKS